MEKPKRGRAKWTKGAKPTVDPDKPKRGRPPKGPKTEEEQYAYSLVRAVQCWPYNTKGDTRRRWRIMRAAINRFMKETHRPNLQNAIYVLLEAGLHEYRRKNPELYPNAIALSAMDSEKVEATNLLE